MRSGKRQAQFVLVTIKGYPGGVYVVPLPLAVAVMKYEGLELDLSTPESLRVEIPLHIAEKFGFSKDEYTKPTSDDWLRAQEIPSLRTLDARRETAYHLSLKAAIMNGHDPGTKGTKGTKGKKKAATSRSR